MYRLLLVGMEKDNFIEMVNALQEHGSVELFYAASGGDALADLRKEPADLVVADEQLPDMSGLELAQKLVVQNPMVNCALVSSRDHADFHEASEGLGIFEQLPTQPDGSQAAVLVEKLNAVTGRNL